MLNMEQQHVQQQLNDKQWSYIGQQASCLACNYDIKVCSIDSASAVIM